MIDEDAFSGCDGIKKVYIDDLKNWCGIRFHFSDGTNPLRYADELICNGEPISALRIPAGVTRIEDNAFSCSKLTSVVIPESVTSIGRYAFERCSLTSVTIPDSMGEIGNYAFIECSRLRHVEIPDSVKSIGSWAFQRCASLTDVTIPDEVTIESRQLPFEDCKLSVKVRQWSPNVTKCLAGATITAIHTEELSRVPSVYRTLAAFGFASEEKKETDSPRAAEHMAYIRKNAGKLRDIMFASKAALCFLCEQKLIGARDLDAYIEEAERRDDPEIKALLLNYQNEVGQKRVSEARTKREKAREEYVGQLSQRAQKRADRKGIEGLVFAVTGKLFTWPSRKVLQAYLEEYGAKLGSGVSKKTDYLVTNTIDENSEKLLQARELEVEILPERAFNEMIGRRYSDGEEVTVPDWLHRMEPDIFKENKNVKRIIVPAHIVEIPENAFSGCTNLESVKLPTRLTRIGSLAFFDCRYLTEITIPDGVSELDSCVFKFCHGLRNVVIPESVARIGDQAFSGCSSLTSVTIPEGVISIGNWAFEGCSSLTSVTIPEGVTRIGSHTFKGCSKLTIHAPAGSEAERYAKKNGIPFVTE